MTRLLNRARTKYLLGQDPPSPAIVARLVDILPAVMRQ